MRTVLPLLSLLIVGPALAAHPLTVDDAGTLDPSTLELEVSSAVADSEFGSTHGVGIAARIGLLGSLDSGVAVAWFETPTEESATEFGVDLKFAPGRAAGWRPRPVLRSDFALVSLSTEAELSFAGVCGGLTWKPSAGVVSVEACWSEPLSSSFSSSAAWSVAGGFFLPVHRKATLAAEYRLGQWADWSTDVARIGLLTRLGRGNLSLGAELPVQGARLGVLDSAIVLVGWTAEFGL